MSARFKFEWLPLLALLIVFIALFARLGELPFRDPDEGRNAEVAREMHQSGAWLVPTYNGQAYLDKPAFFFKAVALSFAAFGESETTARLPSALFATLLLAMLFAFCRREYSDHTIASLAVIITATSPLFMVLARHVIFDMTLAFFVSAAILCSYLAEFSTTPRRWYLLAAAAAGFATLVKGPVGFLIPLLVVVTFNLTERRTGWAKRAFSPWNILIFIAVVLPWFVGLSIERPDFPYYGLVEESFHRFTSTSGFQRGGPIYYYGLVILGGLFAWSLLLPEAAARAWKYRSKLTAADRLCIVWALVVVLFFSISKSKLPHYILSSCGALGILLARLFATALKNPAGEHGRLIFRGLLFLAIFSAVLGGFLSLQSFDPGLYTRIGMKGSEIARLKVLFIPSACVLAFIALMAVAAFWRRDLRVAFATFLLLPVLLLTIDFGGLLQYSEASSSRQIARGIPTLSPDIPIVCLECFPCGLPFYSGKKITLVSTDGSEMTSNYVTFTLRKMKEWPSTIIPLDQWAPLMKARTQPFYLLSNRNSQQLLNTIAEGAKAEVREVAPGWWGALIKPGVN